MDSQPSEINAQCFLQNPLLFPWKSPCGFLREMATAPLASQHTGLSQPGFPTSSTDAHLRGLLFEEKGGYF